MRRKQKEYGPQDRRRQPRHREASPESEAAALLRALPRREMIEVLDGGMRGVLRCGHVIALPEDSRDGAADALFGCRACYYESLKALEMLVEVARIVGEESKHG